MVYHWLSVQPNARHVMPTGRLSTAVNQHYLNKVLDLSDTMEVQASEDIFDARGNKLLARGARLSHALQERLVLHKLTKPLEACIVVGGGVDSNTVMKAGRRIVDAGGAAAYFLAACPGGSAAAVRKLSVLKFGNAMSTMLTISDKEDGHALDHAVTVSLLATGIASKAGLDETEQRVAAMAGLLHDIGELYIDPTYMLRGKRLLPHEWAHRVVHPHTGQLLIDELEAFPAAVGRAVAEHHERLDGSGYPRRSAGAALSVAGQSLSIAETVAAMLSGQRPLDRAALALKIIPGEYSKLLLGAVSCALRGQPSEGIAGETVSRAPAAEHVHRLAARIELALSRGQEILVGPGVISAKSRELLLTTISRIRHVQRAIVSTGLDTYLSGASAAFANDAALVFEKKVATREIQWRLRDIARDLALQGSHPDERLLFVQLINLLDDDYSQCDYAQKSHAAEDRVPA